MKIYDFKEKLTQALPYEIEVTSLLKKKFQHFATIELQSGRTGDAYCSFGNFWVEYKIDFTKTQNHFIEYYSKYESKIKGGPWQYSNVEYYIFYYPNLKELYVFPTKELIKRFEDLKTNGIITNNMEKFIQQNANYTTFGYAVPKYLFQDICLK